MPFAPGNEVPGNLSAVGLAHEATYNTPVTPSQFSPFNGMTLGPETGLFYPQTMMGIRETDVFALYGQEKLAGALDSPLFPHNGILSYIASVGADGSQSGSSTTAKNGTMAAASAGAGLVVGTALTYTTITGGAPTTGDVFMIGPAANGTFGSTALGTAVAPSFVINLASATISGAGPYTIYGATISTATGIPYAISISGPSKNNIAQKVIAPYFHAVFPTQRPISLTVEKNIAGLQSEQYSGCMVNTFGLKLPTTNAEASFSADLMAAGLAVLDTPTPVTGIDAEVPFVFTEGAMSLFGTSVTQMTNVSLNIGNTVKDTYTVASSNLPTFITPTTRTASGSMTAVFYSLDDSTYGYFKKSLPSLASSGAPTQGALSLTLTHPAGAGGGIFNISLPQVNIEKIVDEIKIGDVVMQTLDFHASYNISSAAMITSYFSNTVQYLPY